MADISQDDLNSLLDMFGDKSPALEEQLGLSKQAGIGETLSKPMVEDLVSSQSIPGKSAAESAKTLLPESVEALPEIGETTSKVMGSAANTPPLSRFYKIPESMEALGEAGSELSSGIPSFLSKAALPLTAAYEFLKPTSAGGPQDYPPNLPGKQKFISPKTPLVLAPPKNEEEDSEEPSDASIGMKSSSVRSGGLGTQNAGEGKDKDYLHDLINSVYGGDLGDDAIKSAQAQAQQNRSNALLSKAGSQMGQAFAYGRGVRGPANTEVQDELLKEANVPVENILQRRQAKTQELETGLKASDLIDREKLRDPSSNVSSAYRQMALTMMPGIAQYPNFDSMSAEGIKQLQPMIDTKIKMDVAKDNHQFVMLQKTQMDQAKAKADMTTRIATTLNRGAPAKAMDVDRRVDNINSLVQMYPDLNKMPQNQVNALTDEITQIVTGGMSTEGKAAKLMNPSLMSGFQNLMGKTFGKPTGAQLGLFIKEYIPYMHDLQQNARDYVKDQISPIMVGYNKRVVPSDMDEVKASYTRYFNPKSEATHIKGSVSSQVLDDYAAKHNMNREKAAELLKKAGYNVQGT